MNFNKKKIVIYFMALVVLILAVLIIKELYFTQADTLVSIKDLVYPEVEYEADIENGTSVSSDEVINITESGTYVFSGDYENSTIVVNVDTDVYFDAVYIVLDNANITSTSQSVINIESAPEIIITANANTVNYISQDYSSTETDTSGAVIYSKEDLIIAGSGTIYIETNYNDGINSRDDLTIENTSLYITSENDGIVGKDYIALKNVYIKIEAGKDGVKTSNEDDADTGDILIESGEFIITSNNDSISATNTLQINDGDFTIESGGGFTEVLKIITLGEGSSTTTQTYSLDESSKALKANDIAIYDGNFEISSYEDAVHADKDLYIAGGTFVIACGDDGLHANNNLVIDYVDLYLSDGYEGIEGSSITINDGIINVNVLDDAMNSSSESGVLTINGGEIYLYSEGDGVDSNGDLYITDGTIIIENNAIYTMGDYSIDVAGEIVVTGGSIVDENGEDVDYSSVMSSAQGQITLPSGRR